MRSISSQTESLQRLEDRVARVQTELTRDLAALKDSQSRLERRVGDMPQQRAAALPGRTVFTTRSAGGGISRAPALLFSPPTF